ncbi:MAG TPA: FAD-binding protein, partial [Nitrospira sp.]|nr:FAD-binding protein [Nitrospira sp.]
MDIHALQQVVHSTRDVRRKQTIPKFSPADRDQLIHKYHPDFRASAYRPIRFGPNKGDRTVVELATLLEGDSPIPDELDLSPHYTTDVLVIGGGGAGCAAALHAHRAGSKVMLATKLRLGDSNSVM